MRSTSSTSKSRPTTPRISYSRKIWGFIGPSPCSLASQDLAVYFCFNFLVCQHLQTVQDIGRLGCRLAELLGVAGRCQQALQGTPFIFKQFRVRNVVDTILKSPS